jgi:aspartyl-tRNA(Asn)/glutamyl-tRNA(Gln) amidotransferase subunit A
LELFSLGISELNRKLQKREISAVDIHDSVYKRIDSVEGRIRAYVTVTREKALEMAEHSDKELAAGSRKTLSGIPIAIKDNMCTKGTLTTCASKILSNFILPAVQIQTPRQRVRATARQMDEFGWFLCNSGFHATHNP